VELGDIPTQDVHEAASFTGLTETLSSAASSKKDEAPAPATNGKADLEDVPADVDIAKEGLGSIGFEEDVPMTDNGESEEKGVAASSEEGKDNRVKFDEDTDSTIKTEEEATSQRPDSPA
jgi:hypothetical protein